MSVTRAFFWNNFHLVPSQWYAIYSYKWRPPITECGCFECTPFLRVAPNCQNQLYELTFCHLTRTQRVDYAWELPTLIQPAPTVRCCRACYCCYDPLCATLTIPCRWRENSLPSKKRCNSHHQTAHHQHRYHIREQRAQPHHCGRWRQ